MIIERDKGKFEYLGEKEIAKGAPRLPSAFATDGLLTDNRGDFPFGGHRLSSLYRICYVEASPLTNGYFSASFSQKYSPGVRGWKTPAGRHHTRAQTE